LDEFEQQNIEDAIQWSLTRKFKSEQILSETFAELKKKLETYYKNLENKKLF
jgi:hypothetical protein